MVLSSPTRNIPPPREVANDAARDAARDLDMDHTLLFVPRPHRGQGVTNALLEGAVAYAREHGAKVVEGYPFDTMGISSTHRGHARVFRTAGFEQEGRRSTRSVRAR